MTGEYTARPPAPPPRRLSFERFIVGSSNKFAHAAALRYPSIRGGKQPAFSFRQLRSGQDPFDVRDCKRHPQDPSGFRIIYVKGEDFTNELITAIQEGQRTGLPQQIPRGRPAAAGRRAVHRWQGAHAGGVFHTFNALYEAKKQIVLTSDRPPKEINTLEDRMKTRFEWGLLADIQPPDFETRIAIIRDKAGKMGVALPDNVSTYIAENIQANIRQLGAQSKNQGHARG